MHRADTIRGLALKKVRFPRERWDFSSNGASVEVTKLVSA